MTTTDERWGVVVKNRKQTKYSMGPYLAARFSVHGEGEITDPMTLTFDTRNAAREACRKIRSWYTVATPVPVRVTVEVV